ncbi:unnamed protein product [Caenorhabditis bovis]|uniref:Uncharacterized protein n=1 Tax=Caenorhabditis bovis TaxID=2654633 RepID=A0A8S1EW40_9PELO|nr:unnamed protein product [Caenorhabditis bovis]
MLRDPQHANRPFLDHRSLYDSSKLNALKLGLFIAFLASSRVDDASTNFLNGPAIPVFLFALSVQRSVVADQKYHKYVTGNCLKLALAIPILFNIFYVAHFFRRCHGTMMISKKVCPTKYLLTDDYQECREQFSTLTTIQIWVYVLMHLMLPVISIGFYLILFWRIHKMDMVSGSKKTVELNIIFQTLPILINTSLRIFYTGFFAFIGVDDSINTSSVCSYVNILILIPIGYIFGNVDRLKKMRNVLRRSTVGNSALYANSTVY